MNDKIFLDGYNNMICYKVSDEEKKQMHEEYRRRFSSSNIMNANTIYDKKESRLAGILGEIIYKAIYPKSTPANDMTYDFNWSGFKVDVKCKYRTVKPKMNFETSFFLYQSSNKFNADLYFFMSTIPTFDFVWFCGSGTKKDIVNNPHKEIWRAGETDTSNGMTFREDTLCLKYKYLAPIDITTFGI